MCGLAAAATAAEEPEMYTRSSMTVDVSSCWCCAIIVSASGLITDRALHTLHPLPRAGGFPVPIPDFRLIFD
jgi:hypothetical protein